MCFQIAVDGEHGLFRKAPLTPSNSGCSKPQIRQPDDLATAKLAGCHLHLELEEMHAKTSGDCSNGPQDCRTLSVATTVVDSFASRRTKGRRVVVILGHFESIQHARHAPQYCRTLCVAIAARTVNHAVREGRRVVVIPGAANFDAAEETHKQ